MRHVAPATGQQTPLILGIEKTVLIRACAGISFALAEALSGIATRAAARISAEPYLTLWADSQGFLKRCGYLTSTRLDQPLVDKHRLHQSRKEELL